MPEGRGHHLLAVRNVTKRYGGVSALDDVSAEFRAGEIHAVLGENGAGKSTLMSVLSGFVAPSKGTVELDGHPIPLGRAFECKRIGIEMIHQHFTLVPDFTVAENLALSRLPGLLGASHVAERAAPSLEAAKRLGWELDPIEKVRNLAVGEQQRLEILKALGGDAQVLILDEPTAVLSPEEVDDLFRVMRRLRDEGKIVVLIAHKLAEVLAVADRVTVLRRGKLIATATRDEVDERTLAEWMVGELPTAAVNSPATVAGEGLKASDLRVKGDRKEDAVRGISFEVRRGEILGIGGVDGNGQIELAEAIAEVRALAAGKVTWEGTEGKPRTGYVPQDRQIDGLALGLSVEENLLIAGYRRETLTRGPFLRLKEIHRWAQGLIERFEIRTPSSKEPIASLSGGNQQKVVVSRTLDGEPELLVVVNPTRGLDIRATSYVHGKIREARDAGTAVVLFSTDLDELYALSDRRVFMSRGELIDDEGAISVVGGRR
ncbi:ABC transporter ATP-binding protein [Fimbriimonas ginsengisoli]|uniref:ABC transporter-like protein n=1 Tax=Fimbriimonas ginsengisoli Gsoil 348 TaxID=661478 RepID=A0A068NWB3_FIMGI|nr:ABC transporter ATP-binding protein [Fimbriimonas ginsengisoli]AIE87642.1 ABC transporter-like protein [Fimbriimonas ginsengisoli Gsoil 348]